jgi:hypothetical protein
MRIGKNALSTRIIAWGASKRSRTADSNAALLTAIETEYHTTHHGDRAIAVLGSSRKVISVAMASLDNFALCWAFSKEDAGPVKWLQASGQRLLDLLWISWTEEDGG